jgi:hypothetical protein
MPDALRVLINFPHSMKRHTMNLTFTVSNLKCLRTFRWIRHIAKWNHDHPVLRAIVITQLKTSFGKFGIPADAVEQFVDRNHANWVRAIEDDNSWTGL